MTVERGVRLMAGVDGSVIACSCAFLFPVLALADGIRRGQPVAIGIHKLVSGHEHPARHGPERCRLQHFQVSSN